MTKTTLSALVAAAVIAVFAPDAAHADRRHGHHHGHGHRLHSELPKRVFPHRQFNDHRFHGHGFRGHGFHAHKHFHGHGGGVSIFAPPVITYAVPSYTPEYVPPPPAYAPPAYSYAPPPMQRVVVFPTGRYELHGDGVTTPYRWVWIPNPPASPPVEEPPATPPAPPAAAPTPVEPTKRGDIYRWTDDNGVVHLTDRLDKVPDAYRGKVTKSSS